MIYDLASSVRVDKLKNTSCQAVLTNRD